MSASARLGGGGGREGARWWRRLRSGECERGPGERMRTRESEGERQGGAWRLRGVEEEAGGGQGEAGGGRGLSGARHASVLLARRKTTGGVEMGWAVLGQVS